VIDCHDAVAEDLRQALQDQLVSFQMMLLRHLITWHMARRRAGARASGNLARDQVEMLRCTHQHAAS
jgi:hypothetical protein